MARSNKSATSKGEEFPFSLSDSVSTPARRVQLWIDQLETRARAVADDLTASSAIRERAAEDAQREYHRCAAASALSGKIADDRATGRALRRYCDAVNAVHPVTAQLANDALRNAVLVRESVKPDASDDIAGAVEAAFRAINALWKLEGKQIEDPLRAGLKGLASWRNGGLKRGQQRRDQGRERNAKIRHVHDQLVSRGESDRIVLHALTERFGLSAKQVKRILAAVDTS